MELVIHAKVKPEPKHKKMCTCEECNGTGVVECSVCDGLGKVESDEEMTEQEIADEQGYARQKFWLRKRYGTERPTPIRDYWVR